MSKALIDYYRAIEDSSARMLEAAKSEDWEEVVRFEGICAVLIEQLRFNSRELALMPEERSEKAHIMRRILSNDAQIRYLAEPCLAHCELGFGTTRQFLH
ncbi:MAG: flagellar protein FliT [Burkholderiales bacterium]|nr:flagellar protein FliT [Burkholderiales bacterium]